MSAARTAATGFNELISQIETLSRERDHFFSLYQQERNKNLELEKEFHTLRDLIAQAQKPVGLEENLMLKNQYLNERDLRIQAESESSRLRQQLTDQMQVSHRDVSNLKKALSDMQLLNNKNLQTIYEKGDQNLQQMQQIEDLSAIIRKRDGQIEDLNNDLAYKHDENR